MGVKSAVYENSVAESASMRHESRISLWSALVTGECSCQLLSASELHSSCEPNPFRRRFLTGIMKCEIAQKISLARILKRLAVTGNSLQCLTVSTLCLQRISVDVKGLGRV
jgi:hypothetical protein